MPNINTQQIHLGLGAASVVQPEFTGMDWYESYAERHGGDGAEGRLVSMHRFEVSWDNWEMHPAGTEVVLCTEGQIILHQEFADGRLEQVTLRAGDYVINPPGVWHTADVTAAATALFITCGMGTVHRPR